MLRSRRSILIACGVFGSLSFVLALTGTSRHWGHYPWMHAWELLAGCALAAWSPRGGPRLALFGVAAVIAALSTSRLFPLVAPEQVLLTCLAAAGTAAFISAAHTDSVVVQAASAPWVAWIGRISYPGYLAHIPVYAALAHLFHDTPLMRATVALPVVLLVAALIHHGVERPVLRWSRRRNRIHRLIHQTAVPTG